MDHTLQHNQMPVFEEYQAKSDAFYNSANASNSDMRRKSNTSFRKSFAKEFEDEYGRTIQLPTSKCIFAAFHPVIPDHVIMINKIEFPQSLMCKVI